MKKVKVLLALLLMLMPFTVMAEEDNSSPEKTPVTIYFFHGETCGFCQKAKEWFETIEEEYGKYYTIKEYEVWSNTSNSELMDQVAAKLKVEADGVPFIVIGNKSFSGFNEEISENILKAIKSEYENTDRYDVMTTLNEKEESNDVLSIVILAGVVLVIGGFVFIARKSTK